MLDTITNILGKAVGVLRLAIEVLESVVSYLRQTLVLFEDWLSKLGKSLETGDSDV